MGKRAQTNGEAFEQILESLVVAPSVAQVALGRKLAELCDGEPNAAMISEYRAFLNGLESALPDEPDELDAAQL